MKDKRIIAMFITSAVALVASVVVTLGVALTLADPIPVSFATICEIQIGAVPTNESVVKVGNNYIYENAFEYMPTGAIVVNDWDVNSESCDAPVYPIKNQEFGIELEMDDSNDGKMKIAYVSVTNDAGIPAVVTVGADLTGSAELKKYTKVVVFDYSTNLFGNQLTQYTIPAQGKGEFAVIVYTDIQEKHDDTPLEFGSDKLNVDIVVKHL